MNKIMDIKKIVGKNYDEFWNFKGRYRVLKGGRGSKKSSTAALYFIAMMYYYWNVHKIPVNVLVIRKFYRTLQESCFNQLLWAIEQLGLEYEFDTLKSPLKIIYRPSGGEIFFRSFDDPLKLTSIKSAVGYLNYAWLEEAYEVGQEDFFNKVDMSLRGKMPKEIFIQWTITLNPWSSTTWIKKRFFDQVNPETGISDDGQIMAITRNYYHNEFLDEAYLKIFEAMKTQNPRRYDVEGEGNWGSTTGNIYDNWEILDFDWEKIHNYRIDGFQCYKKKQGLDFGFKDPTAFVAILVNEDTREIFIYDEFYRSKMTNDEIAEELRKHVSKNDKIVCDCAEPKTIEELWRKGFNVVGSKKGRDSINFGIQKIQEYRIYVHPSCKHTIEELSNYAWDVDSKTGLEIGKPKDEFNHIMDAFRYSMETCKNESIYW